MEQHESLPMDHTFSGGKFLRKGYTTGTCAAAAAGAAARMLLFQHPRETVHISTPKGVELDLTILDPWFDQDQASATVRKDESDDPDVTRGVKVVATVRLAAAGVVIDGGVGVGRVTKPGLDQPVGNAAINSTPRKMIADALAAAASDAGYTGGFTVVIEIPDGERLAPHTFNPRAGIVGGISVLGTSGIVEPMSEQAYIDSLRVELRQLFAVGNRDVLITVGNFAEQFSRRDLGLTMTRQVKCSNFVGDAFAAAAETGFQRALLVGHIGKLVKLGIGIFNTHSSHGDGRMETLIRCALAAGGDVALLRRISDCISTDAALDALREAGLLDETMAELGRRMDDYVQRFVGNALEAGFVCFAKTSSAPATGPEKTGEVVARSANAAALIAAFQA